MVAAILVSATAPVPAFAHPSASSTTKVSAPKTVATPNGSWTVYHHDDGHTGYDPSAPALTSVQPGWTSPVLDGEVYAEPLIYNGVVYTATLNDTVYALNQSDGTVLWSKNVGAPQTSGWSCSGLVAGILSTPVIDTAANRIYVAAEMAGTTPIYHLFGLDLGSVGNIVLNVPIAPAGFDWKVQQQRGALAVANGNVYVPFGGRAGDCFDNGTPYYGWIADVPTGGGTTNVFRTPSTAESAWAAGGVVVDDASHNVFFATGNAIPCSGATYSDSIVRVSPALASPTFFEPLDWQANWCGPDSDLGSASPVLISPNLMFTAGKHGGGFLLDPTNLGGINGQLYPARAPYVQADVCLSQHSDATFGSFAYAAPYVYLECESPTAGLGLVALNVNTSTPSFTNCSASCPAPNWHTGGSTRFGPPIVAAGAVWAASDNGLTAYNAATGALIYQSGAFGVNRFVTPAEAGGQVFVPSHTVIRSFAFGGSGLLTVTPSALDFSGQAPATTSAAQTVTLHNNQTVTLAVATAALTGANAANYVKGTDTCTGMTVAAGGTCTVQVSFRPGAFGGLPATLTFTDSGPGSPRIVALNGMGALDNQGHLYTLDGYGGLHGDGSAPALATTAYWGGWNIARSVAVFPDGLGGYVMDGYGGLHGFGNATPVIGFAYWGGWDIAREVVLAPWSSRTNPAGWTLDGYGGIHPFGGAPAITGFAYWGGWDIARGLVILPDSTPGSVAGYSMDGYGGVHPFGGAPAVTGFAYWGGWDIARGITMSPNASKTNPAGWTLDGYGGVHPFGSAPMISNFAYWGWDIARGIVAWTGSGGGGWVMEGYGGIHPFGNAPAVAPFAYWPGWDIAVSMGGPSSSTGSRRRT
jgi:outer membrane protein assembly factor BamB